MAQYSCFVQSFLRISYEFWRFWTTKFYCNVQFVKKYAQMAGNNNGNNIPSLSAITRLIASPIMDSRRLVAAMPLPTIYNTFSFGSIVNSLQSQRQHYREFPYSAKASVIGNYQAVTKNLETQPKKGSPWQAPLFRQNKPTVRTLCRWDKKEPFLITAGRSADLTTAWLYLAYRGNNG